MHTRMGSTVVAALVGASVTLLGAAMPSRAALVGAMEFYHPDFDHYFMTSFGNEAALLDAGTIAGWSRTGTEFKVDDAPGPGLVPVCRFFSETFAPKSSHFYTPFASECASVKLDPVWVFEAEAFYVRLPGATGSCAAGTSPIFRYYNNGQGGAPNHKYTPFRSERAALLAAGWVPEGLGVEGIVFCVTSFFDLALPRTQMMSGGTWEFSYTIAQPYTTRGAFDNAEESGDPDFPNIAFASGLPGFAAWDPVAGKIVVALLVGGDFHGFMFEYAGGNAVQGCAFLLVAATVGPCHPMTGRRL